MNDDEICERLRVIALMLRREYQLEGLMTTREIYQSVARLHDDVKGRHDIKAGLRGELP